MKFLRNSVHKKSIKSNFIFRDNHVERNISRIATKKIKTLQQKAFVQKTAQI